MQNDSDAAKRAELLRLAKRQFKYRNVPDSDLEKMIGCCRFATYRKGSYIIRPDDEISFYYMLLSGSAECHILTGLGAKRILSTMHPGDDMSAPAMIRSAALGTGHIMSLVCLEDCEAGLIPKKDFFEKVLPIHSISYAFLEMMSMMIGEFCMEISSGGAETKLASYLCYLAQKAESPDGQPLRIPRTNSIQKVADILLLSREIVHRILCEFEKSGYIRVERKEYLILDLASLKAHAEGVRCMMGFYGSA